MTGAASNVVESADMPATTIDVRELPERFAELVALVTAGGE